MGSWDEQRAHQELRDNDPHRYLGKGVHQAINNINTELASALRGLDTTKQEELDQIMINLDGTENKSRLGANAILGISLAAARAGATLLGKPLNSHLRRGDAITIPAPMMNILNGGSHADNTIDIQEFMVFPLGADTFSEA